MSVLVIGPAGVGKTTLLTLMQDIGKENEKYDIPATIQTVGTNLFSISLSKKREINLRELGGVMAPLWKNYLDDVNIILFMVDLSNFQQIGSATILLLEICRKVKEKQKLLLLFSKADLASSESKSEFMKLFMMSSLLEDCKNLVSTREYSIHNAADIYGVRSWLEQALSH